MPYPRPAVITPSLIREAFKRSHLSYLTMQTKLNCRSGPINDVLCGNVTSGVLYNKFIDLLEAHWPPPSFYDQKPPKGKAQFYGERRVGTSASSMKSARTVVKPIEPDETEDEEEVQVTADDGTVMEIPNSVKFIPRSQGGGLDPNRPKPSVERRQEYTNPDMSAEGIAARRALQEIHTGGAIPAEDDDEPVDDEDSSEAEPEPSDAELEAIEKETSPAPATTPVVDAKAPLRPAKPPKAKPARVEFPVHQKSRAEIASAFGCSEETVQKLADAALLRGYFIPPWRHFVSTGTFMWDKTPRETAQPAPTPAAVETTPLLDGEDETCSGCKEGKMRRCTVLRNDTDPSKVGTETLRCNVCGNTVEENNVPSTTTTDTDPVMIPSWAGALRVPFDVTDLKRTEQVQHVLDGLSKAMGDYLHHEREMKAALVRLEEYWAESQRIGIQLAV